MCSGVYVCMCLWLVCASVCGRCVCVFLVGVCMCVCVCGWGVPVFVVGVCMCVFGRCVC